MIILEQSRAVRVIDSPPVDQDIHVVMQYFVHANPTRDAELKRTLRFLCECPHIAQIHMLNEQIYPDLLTQPKIKQTNLGARLRFKDVFQYLRENDILGYHVIINSDICFDDTLANLRRSDLHLNKKMMAQLRYEVLDEDSRNLDDVAKSAEIFGPRADSQDTWIFHSDQAMPAKFEKLFNFAFGKPGCDNKLLYLMRMLGYEVLNDPAFVKTYHIHASQERNYTVKDRIAPPYAMIGPYGYDMEQMSAPYMQSRTGNRPYNDVAFEDNGVLHDYIARKLAAGEHFVIPRIAGHENNYAAFGRIIKQSGGQIPPNMGKYFEQTISIMKNNAGIRLSSVESIVKYSDLYLEAFDNCELYAGWECCGGLIRHIDQSHEMIRQWYSDRRLFWASAFDVFHYIYGTPWTHALRGKRILVVSPFEASFREKVDNQLQATLYDGVDLFPECSFLFIKPPQTQSVEPSDEFSVELDRFLLRLDQVRGQYDVALVSCGGYGNLVCNAIYKTGHSAIYVGGVLQMYFGVMGSRWLHDRADVLRLFLNSSWSRPKASERPRENNRVEGACYW